MDENFLVFRSLEVVFEPQDRINFLLRGHVRIFGQSNTESLHEVSDGSHLGTPGVQVVLQEDVIVEWITGVVQT